MGHGNIYQAIKLEHCKVFLLEQGGREMAKDFLLGIDVGTTRAKVALFGLTGKVIASGYNEYLTVHPRPGYAEQNPEDWWRAVKKAVHQVLSISNISSQDIAAIGISSMTITVLPVAKDGKPLYPAIIWTDSRSKEQCRWIKKKVGEKDLDPFFFSKLQKQKLQLLITLKEQ